MAISNNLTTENSQYGIAFDGAYYRIITTSILRNVSLTEVEATAGDTFLAKCYTWIMTQDGMAGSSAV